MLPGAIVYSFATNPRMTSRCCLLSVFAFLFAFIPVVFIFLATPQAQCDRPRLPDAQRCRLQSRLFFFPVVQSFWGAGAVVPAAMFDIGNCVMVAAGTNVLTQLTAAYSARQKNLPNNTPVQLPPYRTKSPRIATPNGFARRALLRTIGKSFFGSVPFDTYLLMIVMTVANVKIPDWIASITHAIERRQRAGVDADGGHAHGPAPNQTHDVKEVTGRHRLAYTVQRSPSR